MTTAAQPEVLTPEVVKSEALTMPQRAQAISKITTHDEYAQAGGLRVQIKTMRKRIADVFGPIVEAAYAAHKMAKSKENEANAPLDLAEKHLKGLMDGYDAEQERIRQEQQRQAEAAARKEEEDRMLAEAQAAEAAGEHEEAAAIIAQPVQAPVVIVPKTVPHVAGLVARVDWLYEITDESIIPREYLIVDTKKIGAVVRAMKGQTSIPGVRAYDKKSSNVRAG